MQRSVSILAALAILTCSGFSAAYAAPGDDDNQSSSPPSKPVPYQEKTARSLGVPVEDVVISDVHHSLGGVVYVATMKKSGHRYACQVAEGILYMGLSNAPYCRPAAEP